MHELDPEYKNNLLDLTSLALFGSIFVLLLTIAFGISLPESDFEADTTTSVVWDSIEFTFIGKEGNTPTSYLWDFGDGNKSSEKNPIHTYKETGVFTVSLTIIDVDGDFNTLIKKNYITINKS